MNKTVELVNLWARFEEKYPEAGIEDFCRYQLAYKREENKPGVPAARIGKMVPNIDGQLMMLLRRIGKFHIAYTSIALEGTGLTQMEEFGMMVTIYNMQTP